jgi:two-component system, cell cycle response regulator DivK
MSKRMVEDQPDNRQIIRDMLAPTDYEITEAENGEEALAAVAKQRPDLILMDIQLPIMDGYTATRKMRADPTLGSIPIIAVTSYALSGEEKRPGQPVVMITFRSPSAHVNYWRKLGNTCNSGGTIAAAH